MTDIIEIENQYYIRAQSSLADNRTRVLMRGIRGLRSSRSLHPIGLNEQGLFYRESRHLSKSVLRLAETQLLLLSSTVRDDNALLAVDLITRIYNYQVVRRCFGVPYTSTEQSSCGRTLARNWSRFITRA